MINNETENIRKIAIDETIDRGELFGTLDSNVRILKENLDVDIMQRDNELILRGKDAKRAEAIFQELMEIIAGGEKLDEQKINYVIALKDEGLSYEESKVNKDIICFTHKGKPLRPKTLGQRKYVQSIRKRDIVFGIGPAGTGKTYIAVAMAVHAFKNKEVQKIILTRPAVEAESAWGFFPAICRRRWIHI